MDAMNRRTFFAATAGAVSLPFINSPPSSHAAPWQFRQGKACIDMRPSGLTLDGWTIATGKWGEAVGRICYRVRGDSADVRWWHFAVPKEYCCDGDEWSLSWNFDDVESVNLCSGPESGELTSLL